MLTRLQAIERLADMVSASVYPLVSDDQLGRLIDDTARWSTYATATAYVVGDIVRPTTPNGRLYRCTTGGTSSATEPVWLAEGPKGRTYDDGDDLVWTDDGSAWGELYDLRKAAMRGWELKAGMVAGLADSSDGSESIRMGTLHMQCLNMARRYRGGGIY